MNNDYPTEQDLNKVRKWDYKDTEGLMDFIESIWWMPSWGWKETQRRYYISTGGWSGNEDIIQAMKSNYIFWSLCWIQTRKGGHYIFERRRP